MIPLLGAVAGAAPAHAAGVHHHPSAVLLVIAGILSGLAVGLTGMGGGALMTPMLVLLFRVDPKVAIASDLVSSLVNKPVGGVVHGRRGTVSWPLVGRLIVGSVPAAFLGAYTLNALGDSHALQADIKRVLGWALIVACCSIMAKSLLNHRMRDRAPEVHLPSAVRTVPTVLVGIIGGFIVGMTSVGSGSVMIVLLMLLYPGLTTRSLVGTDLVQAVPLVASATVGQLLFGHVDLTIAAALTAGSIPGVYVGARLSARTPDQIIRPVLIIILGASALALLFDTNQGWLGLALAIGLTVGLPLWAAVDASLLPAEAWAAVRHDRMPWVVLLAVGAPVGIGLLAAAVYVTTVRRRLTATTRPGRSGHRRSAVRGAGST
jgi:hypothetical protein